jgi:biopolymer transport protein ExbB/TolQ
LGLGDAIGGFGKTIAGTQEVEAIKASLGGVTAGLSTAFDTTLVGLLATISLHFTTNFLKFKESLFLDQCNDYCQVHVLAKLKLISAGRNH